MLGVLNYSPLQYAYCTAKNGKTVHGDLIFKSVCKRLFVYILVINILNYANNRIVIYPSAPAPDRQLPAFCALCLLLLVVLAANAPALALVWGGEVEPLAQYRAYCHTYGDRDPGCAVSLGGKVGTPVGADRIDQGRATLGMAVLVHRQVVDDLTYRVDHVDRWEVLGTPGRGMAGDCDDVVMTTIARLLRRGFPRAALRATIVRLPGNGGHHLILSVRRKTEQGIEEIFLDDRHHHAMRPEQLAAEGYIFVAQEQPGRREWQRVQTQPALMVAEQAG